MSRIGRILALVFTVSLAASAAAQGGEGEKPPAPAPETGPTEESKAALQEVVDGLDKALKEKSDVDLIHYAKQVEARYKGGDPAQQDKIVDALGKMLKSKNKDVVSVTVPALGHTGGKAPKLLLAEINGPRAKDDVTYTCDCIRALGRLRDEKSVKDILKLLNHKDDTVIATAITALGDYAAAETDFRKEVVDNLLKRYGSITNAVDRPNPSTADRQRFDKTADSFESTLKLLTKKTDLAKFDAWDKWYRKDGKDQKTW